MTWAERWKASAKEHRREDSPAFRILLNAYRRKYERHEKAKERIAQLEGPDGAAYGRVLSNVDVWLRICGVATEADLRRFIDGHLNIGVILDHEFQRRFPEAHRAWCKEHDVD